jgi:pimeloyl-ACP methyl ester carboxylesterase
MAVARGPVGGALVAVLAACATPRPAVLLKVGPEDAGGPVAGLDVCDRHSPGVLQLDPARPLTVFVHGCKDSGGRFRDLAQVFEAHGQQTACFNYDHRDRIDRSAGELVAALQELQARLPPGPITVLAHSQGGLVARRALVRERPDALRQADGFTYRLTTVSAPFAGIRASADCGRTWLHLLTLGVTVAVCQIAAGSSWPEIPPGSALVTRPGTLLPEVREVLEVTTDEREGCLERAGDGTCRRRDYVFSLDEQRNPAVEGDPRLRRREVAAGHVEIVGGDGIAPGKLIAVLQEQGVLARTPPERREEIAALVQRLFGARAESAGPAPRARGDERR